MQSPQECAGPLHFLPKDIVKVRVQHLRLFFVAACQMSFDFQLGNVVFAPAKSSVSMKEPGVSSPFPKLQDCGSLPRNGAF